MAVEIEFLHDYGVHHSGDRAEAAEQYAEVLVRLGLARYVGPSEIPQGAPTEAESAGPEEKPTAGPVERPWAGPGQDLTKIRGIGPGRAAELRAAGIVSFGALAEADTEALADRVGVSEGQVVGWQRQARRILSK